MADRKYQLNFELSDGSAKQVQFVVPQGDPGETPEITIHEITGGHQVVVTVGDKTNAFEVMDGEKGADGVTPSIEIPINKIPGGHEVYFVVNGESVNSMLIMDGKDGEDGADGDGAGVTSWNDLEDRPFYNDEFEGYILPETSTGIDVYNKWRTVSQPFASGLILGESYTVSVNSMLCVVKAREIEHNGVVYVGLSSDELSDDWMGAGFNILEVPADMVESIGAYAILPNSSYAENISIYGKGRRLKKIDPILLPDDVGGGVTTWDDLGTEIVNDYLLPEVTVAVQEESGGATLPEFAANVTKGQIYKITYNGTEYECVAHSDELVGGEGNSFLFGNIGALFGGDDTGEPFIISVFQPGSDIGNSMMPLDGSTSVTVSVYGKMEKVVPLPEKYIPITSVYFVKIGKNSDGYTLLNGSFEEISKAFNAGRSVCLDIDREEMSGAPLCSLQGDRALFMSVHTLNSLNFALGIFEITLYNEVIFRKFKPFGEFV